jgi:hypothetical protein
VLLSKTESEAEICFGGVDGMDADGLQNRYVL